MKKLTKLALAAMCVAIGAGAFVACGDKDGKGGGGDKVTVTFYDATGTTSVTDMTVVKKVTIDKNSTLTVGADGTVDGYTPTKADGYEFVNWFATPSKSHVFDFSEAITEDMNVFGGFSKYVADTRDYYIIGKGLSKVLLDGWGVINDDHKFTKAEGKNEYTLTLDLKEGDEFTLNANAQYEGKRGAGYLAKYTLDDGTEVFQGQGNAYDDSSKGSNIKVSYSGNYTLTLTTHPNEDYYDTNRQGYTEERKEIYNVNPYDTIDWVRNGDMLEEVAVVTNVYIKGKDITGWSDIVNDATRMTKNGNVYTLEVYLKTGDEFMFASQDVAGGVASKGNIEVKADKLTEASKAFVDSLTGGNIKAKADGHYTFTYDDEAKTLAVAYEQGEAPALFDYYLDGTFGGGDWGDYQAEKTNKLVKGDGTVYTLEGVELAVGDELILRSYAADTATLGWDNMSANYGFAYLKSNGAFELSGDNMKVVTAGTYNIEFNSYSKMIVITKQTDDPLDIYIKGENINGWAHNWSEDWLLALSADKLTYEITITVEDGKTVKFGLERHPDGEKTGYGDFLGIAAKGDAGDANDKFVADSTNIKCETAGTYKVVYTIATEKVDFYTVQAA